MSPETQAFIILVIALLAGIGIVFFAGVLAYRRKQNNGRGGAFTGKFLGMEMSLSDVGPMIFIAMFGFLIIIFCVSRVGMQRSVDMAVLAEMDDLSRDMLWELEEMDMVAGEELTTGTAYLVADDNTMVTGISLDEYKSAYTLLDTETSYRK